MNPAQRSRLSCFRFRSVGKRLKRDVVDFRGICRPYDAVPVMIRDAIPNSHLADVGAVDAEKDCKLFETNCVDHLPVCWLRLC